ncbi:hypothetical protein EDD15DRAFT_2309795 [Pisolithus albus]|nr:hypothetical protein EDD15DRAFT_2309795 [Pisolithus albus]
MARLTLINRVMAFTVSSMYISTGLVCVRCIFPSDWSDNGIDYFTGLDSIQLRPLGGADLRRRRLLSECCTVR